jgi:hypothetical protein
MMVLAMIFCAFGGGMDAIVLEGSRDGTWSWSL